MNNYNLNIYYNAIVISQLIFAAFVMLYVILLNLSNLIDIDNLHHESIFINLIQNKNIYVFKVGNYRCNGCGK
jgi:hypothetical protein